jgi:hypothetical protein
VTLPIVITTIIVLQRRLGERTSTARHCVRDKAACPFWLAIALAAPVIHVTHGERVLPNEYDVYEAVPAEDWCLPVGHARWPQGPNAVEGTPGPHCREIAQTEWNAGIS